MNIDTQSKITSVNTTNTTSSKINKENEVKFSDELNKVAKQEEKKDIKEANETEVLETTKETQKDEKITNKKNSQETQDKQKELINNDEVSNDINISETQDKQKELINNDEISNDINISETQGIIKKEQQLLHVTEEACVTNNKNATDPEIKTNKDISNNSPEDEPKIKDAIGGLQETFKEFDKLSQKNEKNNILLKDKTLSVDEKKKEENELIDNNINIPEKPEQQLPQMNANMNFNSNGQPFSAFVENTNNDENSQLSATEADLAEESAILSTMSENMAIAQKNMLLNKTNKQEVQPAQQEKQVQPINALEQAVQVEEQADSAPKTKTVTNEQGIKKVDVKTNVTTETIVKFDEVAMNKNDVEFFANLVENGSVDMNSVQNAQKSSQVSKTLADMIAKSMQDNQPIRINFDNDISVIIKVGKNGKISADFLPSSQVAEAYLKENLPILKQRFDDNNIDYEELNHRKQEQQDDRNNRKKGRKDEWFIHNCDKYPKSYRSMDGRFGGQPYKCLHSWV